MRPTPHDAIEGVTVLAIPSRQEEPARRGKLFPIERLEQGHQLVTVGKHTIRVLGKNLAQLLVTGVIGDIAPLNWLRRFGSIELDVPNRALSTRQGFYGLQPIDFIERIRPFRKLLAYVMSALHQLADV